MQVVDQLCNEFEREVSQMTQEMGFFKAVLFFFWEMDIESLKAKQMPLSPTGGPMGRSLEQVRQDIVRYRGELARCADLLAFQLGKEP